MGATCPDLAGPIHEKITSKRTLEIQRKVKGLSRKNHIQHSKSKQRVNPHANSHAVGIWWICEILTATTLSMSSGKIATQGSITIKIPIWSIPSIRVKRVGPNPAAWYKNWNVSGVSQIRHTKKFKKKQVLQLETLFKGICVENHGHIFELHWISIRLRHRSGSFLSLKQIQTKTRGLLKQPESRPKGTTPTNS